MERTAGPWGIQDHLVPSGKWNTCLAPLKRQLEVAAPAKKLDSYIIVEEVGKIQSQIHKDFLPHGWADGDAWNTCYIYF